MAPKKSRKITRLEPEGVELLEAYPKTLQKFRDAGWFNLCATLQGYHEQVSMMFVQNFDGFVTVVGKVLIHVTKHSIEDCMQVIYVWREMVEEGGYAYGNCKSIFTSRTPKP
jgi:hypothetical protein